MSNPTPAGSTGPRPGRGRRFVRLIARSATIAALVAIGAFSAVSSGALAPLTPDLTVLAPSTALAATCTLHTTDYLNAYASSSFTAYDDTSTVYWTSIMSGSWCYAVHYASINGTSWNLISGSPTLISTFSGRPDGSGGGIGGSPHYKSCTTSAMTTCGTDATGSWSNITFVDTHAPYASTPSASGTVKGGTAVSFTSTFSDYSPSSGQANVGWCGSASGNCAPSYGASSTFSIPASGTFTVCDQYKDNAGWNGTSGCNAFPIVPADTTPPVLSFYFTATGSNSYTGTTTSPQLYWSVYDPESGGSYSLNSPYGCSGGLTFSAGVTSSGYWTPCGISSAGAYTFNLSATSDGGTATTYAYYTYNNDTTPPEMSITPPAYSSSTPVSVSYAVRDIQSAGNWDLYNASNGNASCGSGSFGANASWTSGAVSCDLVFGPNTLIISASSLGGSTWTSGVTIKQMPLTVTPAAQSRTYGQAVPAYTYRVSGFQNGQDAGSAVGFVFPTCTSSYATSSPVSSSPLTISCSGGSARDYTFITSDTTTLTISAATQAVLSVTGSASPASYGVSETLGTSGGTGTGTVAYSTGTSTACSVSGNVLTITAGTGTCAVTATKAADSNYNSTTSAPVSITAQPANQTALTVTGTTSPATFGDTQPLGTFGGTGTGTVTYSAGASTACSVSGNTLTITAGTGTCAVTATKAADANYNSTSSAPVSVTVQPAAQAALTITGTTSPATFGTLQTLGTSGGTGTGTVTYSTGSSTACTVSGSTLTITSGTGTCAVTATQAGDANYNSTTSAPVSITVQPASQIPLIVTGTTSPATFGTTQTLGTSGGSGFGAVTYSTGSSTACSVSSGGVLTITSGTGPCSVTTTKAADADYNSVTSAAISITVVKADQAALTITGTTSPATFGDTQTLDTSGGSGTGAVGIGSGFSSACYFSGGTLTITAGSGTCTVNASKLADANYNSTSTSVSITVQPANQAALAVTGASSPAAFGDTQTLGTSGGSGTGAVTYSTGSSTTCSVSANILTITAGTGTCAVTATKAANYNYNSATSAPVSITVVKADQATLTITGATSPAAYGDTETLGTSGGSGTGAVTFIAAGGVCIRDGVVLHNITMTAAFGTCSVTATKAGDANYNSASVSVYITLQKADQAILTVTGTSSPAVYGTTQTLGTSGGSDTGAITYSVGSSTACSISSNVLTITTGTGTCTVVATKAADADYNSVNSSGDTVTVAPAALSVTARDQAMNHGDTNPTFTYDTTGFVTPDAFLTAPTCTVAGNHSAATTYPITCSGADAGSNYSISYHPGTLTVSAIAPTAPLNLTATAGVREVDFAWAAPADNGGLPIVRYNYSYSTDGWATSTAGTTTDPFFKLLGLGDGVTAALRVYAFTDGFSGAVAGPVSATSITLLAPSVSAVSWARAVVVNWTGYTSGGISVASYEVDWSVDAGATWTGVLLGSSQSTYTIPIPSDNTPVSIRVAARYWSTFGPFASVVSGTLPQPTLVATPGVQSIATTISVGLSLDHGVATNYMVALSSDGGSTWSNFTSASLTRTITGLLNATAYLARARAAYGSVWGPWSDSSALSTVTLPTPTLTASVGPRAITASLDGTTSDPAVPAVSKWSYETSADGGSTWTVTTVLTSAPKTITGLLDSTSYLVRGRLAYNGSWGPYSTIITLVTPDVATPILSGTGGARSVALTWSLPGLTTPTGYLISYSSNGGITWTNVTVAASPLSRIITGLPDDTDIALKVAALYGTVSGPVGVATAHTLALSPGTPVVTATAGAGAVTIRWTLAPTASSALLSGYFVEWSVDGGSTYANIKLGTTSSSYSPTIAGSLAAVLVRVSALYGTVNGPAGSGPASLTNLPIPILTATAASRSISAAAFVYPAPPLPNGVNASSYSFAYSSDGGTTWSTFTGTAATRLLLNLTPGTPYLVRVRELFGTAWSLWSTNVSATPLP